MNIDALKQHLRKVAKVEWHGDPIYLRKISSLDGIAMIARIKALATGELGQEQDRKETVDYYAFAISKSMANETGDLELDSDEGRTLLSQMHFTELCELGAIVLRHSGFMSDGEKKSSPSPTCSLSDSVSHLEGSTFTPTTCTLS